MTILPNLYKLETIQSWLVKKLKMSKCVKSKRENLNCKDFRKCEARLEARVSWPFISIVKVKCVKRRHRKKWIGSTMKFQSKFDLTQLNYGFCKRLSRYKWTSDKLNTYSHSKPAKKWKCSTRQRVICTEVTSCKINILSTLTYLCNPDLCCKFSKVYGI